MMRLIIININGTKEQKPGTGSKRAHWHWEKRRNVICRQRVTIMSVTLGY